MASDNEYHDAIEDEIASYHPDYISYKKNILGIDKPNRKDNKCEFYLLTNPRIIKTFINEIKSFAMNYETNEEHINFYKVLINLLKHYNQYRYYPYQQPEIFHIYHKNFLVFLLCHNQVFLY